MQIAAEQRYPSLSFSLDELLDADEVAALVAQHGEPAPDLHALIREHRMFFVVCAGVELCPALQWFHGRLLPELAPVLKTLRPHRAAWKILSWLLSPNPLLGGARPAECLPFDPEAVQEAARLELRRRPQAPRSQALERAPGPG